MVNLLRCCSATSLYTRLYAKKQFAEMKYLNVAEKNDAAKTIAGLLSNGTAQRREGYSVYNKIYDFETQVQGRNCKMIMTSVSGHLMQFAFLNSYRKWQCVDPQTLFDAPLRKICIENYEPIKRTLEREIRSCQGLIIWTDCDREGENIGFEIVDVCRAIKPQIIVYRAVFSEITARGVKRALQQLKDPDKRQSDAVDVRSELDLRTGAAITRFQTMRLQKLFPRNIADKLISYGSCQIPTLGFVAERYKEIEAFVSEPFWKIKVTHTIDDLTVEFNWARNRLFDKQACEDYLLICLADPRATVESVTVKPKSKWRPTPMDTVELEKLGSRKLKLSAKETMTIAEKLYTKGFISYPRTETNQFSKEIDLSGLVQQQVDHSVWGAFAQRVIDWGVNPRNGNKSDQAHPPIHPTKLVTNLDGNDARVYELICRHFLACVSKDAVGSETVVHINIGGEKFSATGLCIYERNYLDVYIYEKWNAKQIHKYEQGQVFEPSDISMHEGATTAPPLLTEADLIALMEKNGIGTDATHAEHINTIKERGYIGVVDKGGLVPGVIGMGLYEGYNAMELALAKPLLRAEFEADLKRICAGEKNPQSVLLEQINKYKEAYRQITDKITAMDEKMAQRVNERPATGNNSNADENSRNRIQQLFQCPKCAIAPLGLKQKKNQTGFFIGCLNFPDCKNTVWLPDDCKEFSVLDECCERCGSTVKLLKLKFQSPLHKSMFNAPFGWYKTCLLCDAQFRNTFNINLENVKRVGAIVGDQNSQARPAPSTRAAPGVQAAPSSGSGRSEANNRTTSNRGNTKKSAPRALTKPKQNSTKTTTAPSTASTSTASGSSGGSIRSYFSATSAARGATAAVTSTTTIDTSTGNPSTIGGDIDNIPLDEIFDSNDSFEELATAAESRVALATETGPRSRASHVNEALTLDASLADAFNDNDDDDFSWGMAASTHTASSISVSVGGSRTEMDSEYTWGTSQRVSTRPPPSAPLVSTRIAATHDDSLSSFFNQDNDLDDFAWGTAERNRRSVADQMAKKPRLSETTVQRVPSIVVDDFHDDLMWNPAPAVSQDDRRAGRTSIPSNSANSVKCSGCHQAAKELTVRKDGPNKGRIFYACPKSKPCKFFQWADELPQCDNNHSSVSAPSVGRSSQPSTSGWGTSANSLPNIPSGGNQENETLMNCACGQPAKSLTVRKDGPNKGRPFFVCANRNKSCDFFKWGDVNEDDPSTSAAIVNLNYKWGTTNARQSNTAANASNTTSNGQREQKKRKCGLCRQEGHTKQKCPRKADYDY